MSNRNAATAADVRYIVGPFTIGRTDAHGWQEVNDEHGFVGEWHRVTGEFRLAPLGEG